MRLTKSKLRDWVYALVSFGLIALAFWLSWE
jgi:hypothetical protein